MKTVSICKATPLLGAEVPSVELRVQDTMPTFALGRDVEREAFFDQQAATLLDALSSLPGGTVDALLVRLLRAMTEDHDDWDKRFLGPFWEALGVRCLDCVTKEMPGMVKMWLQMLQEGVHVALGVQGNEECANCGKSRVGAYRRAGL
jgi:hypothetical protein